jgi:hypothetical protein
MTAIARLRLVAATAALSLAAVVPAAAGECGPNSGLADYYLNEDGQRVWCSSGGAANAVQAVLSFFGGLYAIAESVGGGLTMIASLAAVIFGVFLTGSQRVRVRTYRNDRLVSDEIQGGVGAITDSRSGRILGNLLKIGGIIMFIMGTSSFASHIRFF